MEGAAASPCCSFHGPEHLWESGALDALIWPSQEESTIKSSLKSFRLASW